MKVIILAGGLGTRISEESYLKPKPMIEIGDQPILWHIMKYYSSFGFHDFIICCGYKGHVIKEYFADYYLHRSDVTFDFSNQNRMTVHQNVAEPWRVTLVDTGLMTQTGGRVKRVQKYIGDEPFMLTYGDGVGDIDLDALLAQHQASGKIVTLTGIQPGGRFGVLDVDGQTVTGEEQTGELLILGPTVGPGYFGRPDLTEKVFFTDPGTGLRGYRTGDLCYQRDGLFYYCGRADNQLKLNGYRIELEDIEANLQRLPNIRRAAVVPVRTPMARRSIWQPSCYWQSRTASPR